jgi:hypothetical protein
MLRGKRTVVPGLFNKLSCFGVRFLTRRFASRVATQVPGKPRFELLTSSKQTSRVVHVASTSSSPLASVEMPSKPLAY